MHASPMTALAVAFATAQAATTGFNYGSTFTNGTALQQSDFEAEFTAAQGLAGTSGKFASARLYTGIQADTADSPISAIPAAIATKTTLLLGLWASSGQTTIDNEISALKSAISTYGTDFTDLIVGISVGSEDLYRDSVTGVENDDGVGADPSTLVSYISQVRSAIAGTAASSIQIGHVDTWTAWVNGSNSAVIEACDWLGMDAYPYFQNTESNGINTANTTFYDAYDSTVNVADGKDVWVTETGWPVSGPTENLAVPSVANAETYWQEVGCSLFGNVNTWWYTLDDSLPTTPSPSFGILASLAGSPLYDLTCSSSSASSSSSSSASASSYSSSTAETSEVSASATDSTSATSAVSVSSASSAVSTSSKTTTSSVSAAVYSTSDEATVTTHLTTRITITTCPLECTESATTTASEVTTTATPISSFIYSTVSSSTSSSAPSSASSCPTDLSGTYQYPHLIIPVSSAHPSTAYGTQYDGTLNSTTSTIFNFDIPASYAGETCSLVFLFPEKADLETSSYTFNGQGGISVNALATAATEDTTYASLPSIATSGLGAIEILQAGNGYVIATAACAAGERVSYEFVSTGGLALEFFEDWNPSPLGAFVTVC